MVASMFQGFPGGAGLSRSVIVDGLGGKTQVSGLIASFMVLLTFLFLGPLFKTLPNACLAAIIVITLKKMVKRIYTELPKIYRKSKIEGVY
jgi:MFS superfamily sulfate permease-like transporter